MKKLFLFCLCCHGIFTFGQEVNKDFTKLVLNEQFNQVDKNWSSTFNADNLFIAQSGFYELYRKSAKSGYYLFANNAEEYSSFQMETEMVFNEHNNKKQSGGVVMMAQNESSGLLVEINQKREYRVVRVYKDKQVPVSGGGSGWHKATSAITRGTNNILVKAYDKVYDLYINGKFLETFTDIELNKGKIGIYVGPDSKVKFDYLKVLQEEKKDLQTIVASGSASQEESFTLIIVKLRDQINAKDKEIDELKTRLKLCESSGGNASGGQKAVENQTDKVEKEELQTRINELETESEDLRTRVGVAESELEELREFKKGVEASSSGDIVINLTNIVSKQTATINDLEKKVKSLNDESNGLFVENKDLVKQLDKSTNQLTEAKTVNQALSSQIDSLKALISRLRDTLAVKSVDSVKSGTAVKPMTEEERLQQMIEKERQERLKRKEEEERRRKEEEEKNKNGEG